MSYTKGPWTWYGDFLRGPGGEVKFCRECGSVYRNSGSIDADARLIAAAQLMLEALEYIVHWKPSGWEPEKARDLACAAIAQAKGEA